MAETASVGSHPQMRPQFSACVPVETDEGRGYGPRGDRP